MPPLTHCSLQAANALSPLQRQWPGEAFCVCQKQELLSHAPHHGSPQFSIANLDLIPCRGFGTGSQDQAAKVHALYAPVEATGRASDAARGPSRRLASSPMIRQPNLHVRASSVSHEELQGGVRGSLRRQLGVRHRGLTGAESQVMLPIHGQGGCRHSLERVTSRLSGG